MSGPRITLLEYVNADGKNVFRIWLRGIQDASARARIRVRLNRARLGNFGDAKPVGEGVSELRIAYGLGYRVYFGRQKSTVVILLMGGIKKEPIERHQTLPGVLG